MKFQCFVLDVDGVLTDGTFLYSEQGKKYKRFGPDDADALALLKNFMEIRFVSADHRGFPITKKRVFEDMGFPLDLVSQKERLAWIEKQCPLDKVIYMGDGFWDHLIFQKVGYSIAPSNAFFRSKNHCSFVTTHKAGDRAVAEAVIHIAQKFLPQSDLPEGLR